MVSLKRLLTVVLSFCSGNVLGLTLGGKSYTITNPGRRELLQDLVRDSVPFLWSDWF